MNNAAATPALTSTDHAVLLGVIESIANQHGLQPHNIRRERTSLGFTLSSVSGGSRQCWATWDGLTVGGCGLMAGSLADAMRATCWGMV